MKNSDKKPKEFSKVFAITILVCTCLVTVFSCYMSYITLDTTIISVIVPAIFAELATSTGFYYSKAKAENKIKLKNSLISQTLELQSKYSIEDINRAEEIINEAEQQITEDEYSDI